MSFELLFLECYRDTSCALRDIILYQHIQFKLFDKALLIAAKIYIK